MGGTLRTVRVLLENGSLLRLLGALALSGISGWMYFVALQVFAYDAGREAAVGLVGVLALIPAGIAAPFASVLVDRYRRERVLLGSSLFRVVVLGAIAAIMVLDGPAPVVYALVVLASVAARLFYPAQAALLPSLARHPEELTAANSLTTGIQNVALLVGPAIGGALVAVTGPGATVAVAAGVLVAASVSLAGLQAAARKPVRTVRVTPAELLAGLRAIVRAPSVRRPVGVYATVMLGDGVLGVLTVVLAFTLLGIGQGGVGYLNAALGLGAVAGAVAGLALARLRQGPTLAAATVAWGASLALIAAWPRTAIVLLLLVAAGAAFTIVDVSCVTLLQRATEEDVRGRVFGVLEGMLVTAAGIGAAVAAPLDDLLGTRVLLLATGAAIGGLGLFLALRAGEAADEERETRIHLLRAYPPAARLGIPVLEGVAAALVPVTASRGDVIVREGDAADRFYMIAHGTADVLVDGRAAASLRSGDWFGERALLSGATRTATVAASADIALYALDRETFLENLGGFAAAPAARVRPSG
jgi:predicted MFS family arabinose efflux permease